MCGKSNIPIALDEGTGFVLAGDLDPVDCPGPWVAFLPALDPTMMGWKERDWYCRPDYVQRLFDRNGNASTTVWVDGRVLGGWAQRQDGTIVYEIFEDVDAKASVQIKQRAASLEAWLGDMVFIPGIRTPLERSLSG